MPDLSFPVEEEKRPEVDVTVVVETGQYEAPDPEIEVIGDAWPVSRQRRLTATMAGSVLVVGGLVAVGAAVFDDGGSSTQRQTATVTEDAGPDCRAYGSAATVRPC